MIQLTARVQKLTEKVKFRVRFQGRVALDHWPWIIEALVPVLKVVADVLVIIHCLHGWQTNF